MLDIEERELSIINYQPSINNIPVAFKQNTIGCAQQYHKI